MKRLLFLLGGLLIMITISGCSTKPSKQEIINKFDDFITIFPSKDLTFLYDKEGDMTDLVEGNLGTWVVSSYKYTTTDDGKRNKIGVVLWFDRNTRQAKGTLIINRREKEEDTEYPVFYDKEGIHFIDTNVDESLVKELTDFKMLSEMLMINDKYLSTVPTTRYFYNGEVPLYGVTFKLNDIDENIKKIIEFYPNLPIDKDNLGLKFEGVGTPWKTNSNFYVELFLDSNRNTVFTTRLSFAQSDLIRRLNEE